MKLVLVVILIPILCSAEGTPLPFPEWVTRHWMENTAVRSFIQTTSSSSPLFYRIRDISFEKISDQDQKSDGARIKVVFDDPSCQDRWFAADYYAGLCSDFGCTFFVSLTDCKGVLGERRQELLAR